MAKVIASCDPRDRRGVVTSVQDGGQSGKSRHNRVVRASTTRVPLSDWETCKFIPLFLLNGMQHYLTTLCDRQDVKFVTKKLNNKGVLFDSLRPDQSDSLHNLCQARADIVSVVSEK